MTLRRMKSYTGGQGYVYQYYFVGERVTASGQDGSTEYIFDVTSDRKTTYSVSVFLPKNIVGAWAASHGRPLTDGEQYGAVKLRLFQAFDEIENLMAEGRRLELDAASLESALAALGVD